MKRSLKFYVSIIFLRLIVITLKIFNKNATNFPGKIALKIYPEILEMFEKPKINIFITGTNGKTTTTNILADTLSNLNETVMVNRLGSNMLEGVISTFLLESSFFGNSDFSYGVFEIDEMSLKHVSKHLKCDYLIYTNQYRDSVRREAHAEYIYNRINNYIDESATLILNGDDPISMNAGVDSNKKVFFGIDQLEGEIEDRNSKIRDIIYDFKTYEKLNYSFVRYHHMGRVPGVSPHIKYPITHIDDKNNTIRVNVEGVIEDYLKIGHTFTDLYNEIAVIALLRELKYSKDKLNDALAKIVIPKSRFEIINVNGVNIYLLLSKGQSPIAASRNYSFISEVKEDSSVIIMNEENYLEGLNSGWFHEIDYAPLKSENIKQIITAGYFAKEFHICLLMDGIDDSLITSYYDYNDSAKNIDIKNVKNIFILYGLDTIHFIPEVKEILLDRLENKE